MLGAEQIETVRMKPVVLCLCLSALSLVAQASIGSSGRQDPALPAQPAPPTAAQPAPGAVRQDGTIPQRRSRMADAGPADGPVMKLSAMYRVTEPDASSKDNCLKGTGTRLKRAATGVGACTIGSGQVFVPEH